MSPLTDTCPQCGARLFPVLEDPAPRTTGAVPADPPFRLACPTCPPPAAPSLT
jgi:hypothetical protein